VTATLCTAGRENGRRRPKGYAAWRPQQKTRILLGQVQEILAEYADYLPLSVRQIFYRLVGAHGYEKTEQAYDNLGEKLVRARRARLIPFEWIRDDGVVVSSTDWYADVDGFHMETARRMQRYRRDLQQGQPVRVELWCEAAGMLPQLDSIAREFSVEVYSASGFVSLTAVRDIVDRALTRTVPTVLLHVGDYDPSGESIFETIAADAMAFIEEDQRVGTQQILPVRVALTAAQVEDHELPTAPAKSSDSRSRSWEGETCQLEALAPDDLAAIVEEAILAQLDRAVLRQQMQEQEGDRAELLGLPRGAS
jgi:hypothetical protein